MLNLDERCRRASYRAWRRGTREMDLLLGRFADERLAATRFAVVRPGMDEHQLAAFEALLDETDGDIYDWLMSDVPYQGQHQQLIAEIRAFHAV